MDDEDWVEKYREEEFPAEKPTLWQRIKYVLMVVAVGVACGVGTTFVWSLL
jgi:hypothetical protein